MPKLTFLYVFSLCGRPLTIFYALYRNITQGNSRRIQAEAFIWPVKSGHPLMWSPRGEWSTKDTETKALSRILVFGRWKLGFSKCLVYAGICRTASLSRTSIQEWSFPSSRSVKAPSQGTTAAASQSICPRWHLMRLALHPCLPESGGVSLWISILFKSFVTFFFFLTFAFDLDPVLFFFLGFLF